MAGEAAAQIASDRGGLSVEVFHGLYEPLYTSPSIGKGPGSYKCGLEFLRAESEGEVSSITEFIDPGNFQAPAA